MGYLDCVITPLGMTKRDCEQAAAYVIPKERQRLTESHGYERKTMGYLDCVITPLGMTKRDGE
jgi:hypothetical protein